VNRYIQTTFFIGNFVGVLASGFIADKLGRRFCFLLFLSTWILSGATASFVPNLYVWMILRFICGAMSLGYNNALAVFNIEQTHGKWRSIFTNFFSEAYWNMGHISLGGLVYVCRDMSRLELIIALSAIPYMLGWVLMPESPRWLLAQGKKDQAKKVLRGACWLNKKSGLGIDSFVESYTEDERMRQGEFFDLFRTPGIRRNSILMCFVWLSFSMGYYGLIYNTPALNWNIFLVFIFPGVINLVMCYVDPFLENYFGRKFMQTVPISCAGIFLLLTTVMPKGHLAIIILAWLGTVACSLAIGDSYTFTEELYPTVVRTTALSTASASARIGSIISPFIAMLDTVSDILPLLVYGIIVLTAGFCSMWIWPETKSIKLPDTLEESEELASSKNELIACLTCRKIKHPVEVKI
jgi:MFS family permease